MTQQYLAGHNHEPIRPPAPAIAFATDLPSQKHSRPSRAAAKTQKPRAPGDRQRIYDYLKVKAHGGATDEELSIALGIRESSIRPRRGELVTRGLVRDSGKERLTTSGHPATIWTTERKE